MQLAVDLRHYKKISATIKTKNLRNKVGEK